ncbi:hypothetical protein CRENBAI_005322 [Crenichthys baileyi]|uniref:Secreted protein n=1 Tax=Crenichthys baileyi TaxID=28760 RepID=A0AAV9RN88_9TELE
MTILAAFLFLFVFVHKLSSHLTHAKSSSPTTFVQIRVLGHCLLGYCMGNSKNKPLQGTAGSRSVYVGLTDMIYGKYYQGPERRRRRMKEEKMKASECKHETGGRVKSDTGFWDRKMER